MNRLFSTIAKQIFAAAAAIAALGVNAQAACYTLHGYMDDGIGMPYPYAPEGRVQLVRPETGLDPEVILQTITPDPITGYYEVTPEYGTGVPISHFTYAWHIRPSWKRRWSDPRPEGNWYYNIGGGTYFDPPYYYEDDCLSGGGPTIFDLNFVFIPYS